MEGDRGMSCSFQHDSTVGRQKLKKSSAHAKRVINIPPGVSVEDAMKLYNTGYGHAISAAIGFFTKEIGLLEQDSELKDAFVYYMRKKLSKRNIHLQQPKEPLFNPEELHRTLINPRNPEPPHCETEILHHETTPEDDHHYVKTVPLNPHTGRTNEPNHSNFERYFKEI